MGVEGRRNVDLPGRRAEAGGGRTGGSGGEGTGLREGTRGKTARIEAHLRGVM